MMNAPTSLPFDQAGLQEKVLNLFDDHKTLSSFLSAHLDGNTLIATFTNRNPDGSNQTTRIDFSNEESAVRAKSILDKMVADHRAIDRSHDFRVSPQPV